MSAVIAFINNNGFVNVKNHSQPLISFVKMWMWNVRRQHRAGHLFWNSRLFQFLLQINSKYDFIALNRFNINNNNNEKHKTKKTIIFHVNQIDKMKQNWWEPIIDGWRIFVYVLRKNNIEHLIVILISVIWDVK